MLRRLVPAGLAAAALAVALALPVRPSAAQAPDADPVFAPGELLVQFRAGASDAARQDALVRVAGRVRHPIRVAPQPAGGAPAAGAVRALGNAAAPRGAELDLVATGRPVLEAAQALAHHPAVAFAEPNWLYTHQDAANDPYYTNGSLWGMFGSTTVPTDQYGSQAGAAWNAGHLGSSSVYVGVIDEGIDFQHPDLSANIWTNPFDGSDSVDNDGNGYVDDIHGWNFYSHNNSIYGGSPGDNNTDAHGTHVSGTIGGVGGNGAGVAGVNWHVTVISAKFLGPNGGYTADAVAALDYLTDLKTRHSLDIVAANNSWGGGGYSQALHDAILRAAKADILFVAAAGNSGTNNDKRRSYPSNYDSSVGTSTESAASYDSVIAVAALTSSGSRPTWSNYGAKTVDLGAPGSGIWSTTPNGTYSNFSGTSMATPHVTGAAALYRSTHPSATAFTIKNAILNAARATPTASMSGRTVTGGRLNVSGF
jgi:subtilisin family serine protease